MSTTTEQKLADVMRATAAGLASAVDNGERSAHFDAHDVVDLLLHIAEQLDPETFILEPVPAEPAQHPCPQCGNADASRLPQLDEPELSHFVRCDECCIIYAPGDPYYTKANMTPAT